MVNITKNQIDFIEANMVIYKKITEEYCIYCVNSVKNKQILVDDYWDSNENTYILCKKCNRKISFEQTEEYEISEINHEKIYAMNSDKVLKHLEKYHSELTKN